VNTYHLGYKNQSFNCVCSETKHAKHINALREQNVEFWNVKTGGTYNNSFKMLRLWTLGGLFMKLLIFSPYNGDH